MNASLQHCTTSKETYADCFEAVKDSLTELCRQTVDLSLHFANLTPKITFDTFSDDDVDVLVYICEHLCTTASHLSQLSDLRAFVAVWRAYASLVSQHHSCLTTTLDTSVPLKALVKEIGNGFEMLKALPFEDKEAANKTQKIMQRTIKTINFCLKIVVAICEKYRGYLRGGHCSIASLLLLLFRYSPGNVILKNFPNELKKEIETQLTIGIEPLLLHLREDEDFVKVLFEDKKELTDEIIKDWSSYLLLLVAVALPPSATVLIHLKKFLSAVFSTMQKSHVSLSLPCTMDGVTCKGKQQSKVSLYEHVLTRMCVLVAGLDGSRFRVLEEVLLEWLLSGQTWPALLAADVWCFVSRYGTSNLCWDYCMLLLDILPKNGIHSHQRLIVSSLLSRLIPKLTAEDKDRFVSVLKERRLNPGSGTSLLLSVLQFDGAIETREIKCSVLKSAAKNISSVVARKATGDVVFSLREDLEAISLSTFSPSSNADVLEKAAEKEFAEKLAQLWKRMPEKLIGSTAMDEMLSYMVYSSILVLGHFSNTQLFQILSLCRRSTSHGTPAVCLAISSLIGALGHISVSSSPEKEDILSLIARCLSALLKSSSSLILQSALEAFVTFGKHTVHEKVLPMTIEECDEDLQMRVTNHLKQEPLPPPAGHTRLSLIQMQMQDGDTRDEKYPYISISSVVGDIAKAADSPLSSQASNQDDRGTKRKRSAGSPTSDAENVSSLIAKLQESQRLLVGLNAGSGLVHEDRRKIQKCLQDMLQLMGK
ncbi:FIGNL1-interacting regulator of recombination and mitosis-like isoform X1 [Palaemon carinicauda]